MLIESAAAMLSEIALDTFSGGDPLSPARTVKFDGPGVWGVPLRTPALDKLKPAGSVPEVTVQEYGVVPPVAANV